jgi:hypothetical protein
MCLNIVFYVVYSVSIGFKSGEHAGQKIGLISIAAKTDFI